MPNDLHLRATRAGLSTRDVSEVLSKWGEPVLKLVVDALKEGFSWAFILEILETIGPLFLTQALSARRLSRSAAELVKSTPQITMHAGRRPAADVNFSPGAEAIFSGDEVKNNPAAAQTSILVNILVPLLIQLLQSQGPQIAEMMISWLVDLLKQQQNQAQLKAMLTDVLANS